MDAGFFANQNREVGVKYAREISLEDGHRCPML